VNITLSTFLTFSTKRFSFG